MTVEDNKAVVRSFFEEALDKGNMGLHGASPRDERRGAAGSVMIGSL